MLAITIIDKIAQQLYFDIHSETPTSPVEAKYSERKEEMCELHVEVTQNWVKMCLNLNGLWKQLWQLNVFVPAGKSWLTNVLHGPEN